MITATEDLANEEQVRARNRAAWAELYKLHFDAICGRLARWTGTEDTGWELTQETFTSAFANASAFEGRSPARAWLLGIAINQLRLWRRKQRRNAKASASLDCDPSWTCSGAEEGSDDLHARVMTLHTLTQTVEALPVEMRQVFVLRELKAKAPRDAALELGISYNNFLVRASRARAKVRAELKRSSFEFG
jgi:RNA polymerase sigma-70 factor (ECF subfamily)